MGKNMRNLIGYNVKTLIGFEAIYKILSFVIFTPLFLSMFQMITRITGYDYLTYENIFSFLISPMTILFLVLLLVFITFYSILDIGTIIVILDSSRQKKKINIKDAFIIACQKSVRIFHRKNIFFPFLVLFLIPFLNLGISSGFISTISLPEFISDYIEQNSILSIFYFFLLLFLAMLLYRWLYMIHYFILENCNFKEAKEKSIALGSNHRIKDFLTVILTQLITVLLYVGFIFAGIFLIGMIYNIFHKNIFGSFAITIIWLFIALSFLLITLLSTPISYAVISALYYHHKEAKQEKIIPVRVNVKEKPKMHRRIRKLEYVLALLVLVSSTIFTYSVMNGKYDLKIEYVRTMDVTAHRGASAFYPENTMSAFRGAKELGADWIELDVQQTKDQKLIVLHDTNLKRTTNLNKNTWEVTYDEVAQLDAGSFFSSKFKGEKIPLLEEVIQFAKENNIRLNIELKPTGKEKDFEKSVVEMIEEYDFINQCVVTSQVYQVLVNVKEVNPNIKTVYVTSLAYGDITELTAADSFSIEASSATKVLVRKVHNAGKEVYVWTVNSESNIRRMVELNVDNIITDNITLAKDTIYSSKTSDLIQEYIKWVNRVFS